MVLIHIFSFLALGICFELPELALNIWCTYLARSQAAIGQAMPVLKRVMQWRYVLTHVVGPFTGMVAVLSGIYLVHAGHYSFQQGWLFWIMVAATIGLYKGVTQHNAYIRLLQQSVNGRASIPAIQRMLRSPWDQVLILLELPTYAFIYYAASVKPAWVNPAAGLIRQWEKVLPQQAWVGIVILVLGTVLIFPLRFFIQRYTMKKVY